MFASLYRYFKKRRWLLATAVTGILALSVYTASQGDMQEDISQMLPLDEDARRTDEIRKNIRFNDRIIIILENNDSAKNINSDSLSAAADSIFSHISSAHPEQIETDKQQALSEAQSKVYDIFLRHLPVFLTEEDYATIDSMLTDSAIHALTESNFKNLISPTGSFTKQYIKKDPLSLTPRALKRLEKLKPDDNFILKNGHVFTQDESRLLLFVNLKHGTKAGEIAEVLETAEKECNLQKSKYAGLETYLFGAPVVANGNSKRIKSDILFTVALALLLLILFLSIFFRQPEIFLIIFLPAVFGASVSLAVIHLIQDSVSLISLGIGSVLTGISIDYSLHIINHLRKSSNTRAVFKAVSVPILISSLSTGVAFFALLFVSSQALRDLGLFAGISVMAAALFALIVLPHIVRKRKAEERKSPLTERIAGYNWHKSKLAHIVLILLTLTGVFFAGEAEFEEDPDKMNYMDAETIAAQDKLNTISGLGYRTLYVAVEADNLDKALEINQAIGKVLDQIKQEGLAESYSSVHPVLLGKSVQQERIRRWEHYFSDERKAFLKEKLIEHGQEYGFKPSAFQEFYALLHKDFAPLKPSDEDFQTLYSLFGSDLISETNGQYTVLNVVSLKENNKAAVKARMPENDSIVIIDSKAFTEQVIGILKNDFNRLVYLSLGAVFLILLLYYGRIELSIITFLPIVLSWVWTMGIMSLFHLKLTIFNIIISSFIFGLGIDYSIFIMQGLLRNYRYGHTRLSVFKTSVLLSAVTTLIAIGVLIFAKHPAMRSIALLSVIGISSVVFAAYTLLPVGFNYLVSSKKRLRKRPLTAKDIIFSLSTLLTLMTASLAGILTEPFLRILPFKKERKALFLHKFMQYSLKAVHFMTPHLKYTVHNPNGEDFKRPAVIIANHQGHLDIAAILVLHPKIIIMTNDWVQKNFFYGRMVRYAGFPAASNGYEKNTALLKEKVKQGYSVLIFPEGTRSEDGTIGRFHKGAFHYARELELDVLPVIIHGTGHSIPKHEPVIKSGEVNLFIEPRIRPNELPDRLRTQAKIMRQKVAERYAEIRQQIETPEYFRRILIGNYLYKGPILEHYTRIKIRTENYYRFFHEQCPTDARITDIGCGYGYLPLMLGLLSDKRQITGIDYDCNKIRTANHTAAKPKHVQFHCADVLEEALPESDVFILADVLHYLPKESQEVLILKCVEKLRPGGKIIIRDGNSEMKAKHRGTKLSEFFSVKLLKFNKAAYGSLSFTSLSEIQNLAESLGMETEVIDQTKHTSNLIYMLSKTGEK